MLELEVKEGVATLWLARPEVRNALDATLIKELTRTLGELARREEVRTLILAGRGSVFCAGADLHDMQRMVAASNEVNRDDALALATLFATLDAMPQPVVAQVHGACVGGALGLICAADIVIAAADTTFAFSEVRVGLVPATIMPYAVRAMGHRAASRLMLTAETFDAACAKEIGLIHAHVPATELDRTVALQVQALRQGGSRAQRETKRLLRHLQGRPLDESLQAHTANVIAEARVSAEAQARLTAFLERRRS